MSKYNRSTKKLVALVSDILAASPISLDTRVIVLFLAGSMPSDQFNAWIDPIHNLDALNVKFKEINLLRNEVGPVCQDYILLKILENLTQDISSDELQQFIQNSNSDQSQNFLPLALTIADLNSDLRSSNVVEDSNFVQAKHTATTALQDTFSRNETPLLSNIIDIYTQCRQHAEPLMAYAALVTAIQDILQSSGVNTLDAKTYSDKLASQALDTFIHNSDQAKPMFFTFKSEF